MTKCDTLTAGLLSLILAAVLVPYAITGVDMHHDGIMLKPALDVLSGQVLFRDTFMQYGALTCYLQVAALAILPRLLTIKLLVVAVYAFSLFLFHVSWREILPRSLAICASGMFILFIPHYERSWLGDFWIFPIWSSAFAMLFQSLVLYALFHVIRNKQPLQWAVILGGACACVWWCRQPVGITTTGCLIAIGAALNFAGWSPQPCSKTALIKHTFLGFAAVTLIMVGSIVLSGAGAEWWYQNYLWPKKWAAENVRMNWSQISTAFIHPFSGFIQGVLLLVMILPAYLKKDRPPVYRAVIAFCFLCLIGLLLWKYTFIFESLDLRRGGWTLLIPAVVVIQAAIGFALIFRKRNNGPDTEYLLTSALAALCLSALVQYYPLADAWHVFWSISPAFGLFVFLFWRWSKWSSTAVTVGLAALLAPALWYKINSIRDFNAQSLVSVTKPAVLRGMRVGVPQAANFARIADLVDMIELRKPDYPSVLIGNDAMYLCFGRNRQNPSPYFVTWPGLADNEHNQKRWDYIQRVRPLLFVLKPNWTAVDDYYAKSGYEPLLYLENEALEIAAPNEVVKFVGLAPINLRHERP